uniref:Uncharacterized protein n=1 Tax=Setaria italica TaxID=4555 RepID=K4AHD1_SETIT
MIRGLAIIYIKHHNCSAESSSLILSLTSLYWRDHNWPLGSNELVALRCAAFCHSLSSLCDLSICEYKSSNPISPNVVFYHRSP